MSALGWLTIGVLIMVALGLLFAMRSVLHRLRAAEQQISALHERVDEFGPLLADTRSALRKAENRNLRADDLVSAATSVTTRADAASKLAYQVATNPLVRLLAWGRGVRRGLGTFRTLNETSAQSRAQPRAQLPPTAKAPLLLPGRSRKRK
jgi:hypothetical protein